MSQCIAGSLSREQCYVPTACQRCYPATVCTCADPRIPKSDLGYSPPVGKDTNPKDALATNKLPYHLWPMSATSLGALALLEGALKYGRANWRASGVRASVYYDALQSHMSRWFEGEDLASDSQIEHLGHALACLAIIVDARTEGMLVDDRQFKGEGYRSEEFRGGRSSPVVAALREKYAGMIPPKHYTIADNPEQSS